MKRLAKPRQSAGVVFERCAQRVKSPQREKFLSITSEIEREAKLYDQRGKRHTLHCTEAAEKVGADVSTKEMVNLYDTHLAREGSVCKPIYDELKAIPKLGRCPLCGIGTVSTLDHYLPKSVFPQLAVTPTNLVAACRDCNTAKKDNFIADPNLQTIHPYYDDFDDERWIFVEIVESNPIGIQYIVSPPTVWPPRKRARAQHHFDTFELADPYRSNAIAHLRDIQYRLEALHQNGGFEGVREHLSEELESRLHSPNGSLNKWDTALFESLAHSDWFCDGGFRNL